MLADIANGVESLVIFRGPDAYISPSWYATKKETGKVVPTWNYAAVHACGVLRIVDDASCPALLAVPPVSACQRPAENLR